MDHVEGALVTGSSKVEDLTTRCRLHNNYRARQRYGAEHVQRRIEEERRAREARRALRARRDTGTLCEPVAAYMTG